MSTRHRLLRHSCSGGVSVTDRSVMRGFPPASGTGVLPVMSVFHRQDADATFSKAVRSALIFTLNFTFTLISASAQQEMTPAQQKAADLRLPELDRTALLPERRAPTDVREGERNPFGNVSLPPPEEEKEAAPVQAETEEMKIRRVLGNMRITGLAGAPGDYTVLLGPLMLRQGGELPRLFADQAEVLRVSSVTDRDVVLTFAEKDPNLPPRTIGLSIDLKPRVHSLLVGDLFTKTVPFDKRGAPDLKPLDSPAVKQTLDALDKQGLESLIERRRELMGEASYPPRESEPQSPKSE